MEFSAYSGSSQFEATPEHNFLDEYVRFVRLSKEKTHLLTWFPLSLTESRTPT